MNQPRRCNHDIRATTPLLPPAPDNTLHALQHKRASDGGPRAHFENVALQLHVLHRTPITQYFVVVVIPETNDATAPF
eukprot:2604068-Rhodomonas_salina.1